MKLFDFFKKKKQVQNIKEEPKIIEDVELTPNKFHIVSKYQFTKELEKRFDLEQYSFGMSNDEKAGIYIGDINDHIDFDFNFNGNLLIVGNITKKSINLTDSEGGFLFITGNVIGDYFSNGYSKLVMINGSLTINKILNTEFENSCLVVKKNLTTEYFHGIDIWADVKGKIDIDYGWGYCNDKNNNIIQPKNNLDKSLKFLNVTEDCDCEIINGIIINQINNEHTT